MTEDREIINRALIIYDEPNWAFDRMADALIKYCKRWEIVKAGIHEGRIHIVTAMKWADVVLWLPDYRVDWLSAGICPKYKTILAIRHDPFIKRKTALFYNNPSKVKSCCSAIAAANVNLGRKIAYTIGGNPSTYCIPGGVDEEFFDFKTDRDYGRYERIGWAGSINNFGSEIRGIDLIREACDRLNLKFVPALREDRWRSMEEMRDYYHNEIDVYVDAHENAGRQNGLLEAAACGMPIIATKAGISDSLIDDGENGIICEHGTVKDLAKALTIMKLVYRDAMAKYMRQKIEKEWTWHHHAGLFEDLFDKVLGANNG